MIKIGITGGIGSGKSVVARLFTCLGIPVYIADDAAKQLLNTSKEIRTRLTARFGEAIYTPEGIDKPRLASLIFSDKQHLAEVNQIVHPVVAADFQAWAARQRTPFCAMEAAILFESGFDRLMDKTLLVYAPEEARIRRSMQRDHATRTTIEARIRNQQSDEQKKEWADAIITNDDLHPLIPQVENILALFAQ